MGLFAPNFQMRKRFTAFSGQEYAEGVPEGTPNAERMFGMQLKALEGF
jgi:hypothetical protein